MRTDFRSAAAVAALLLAPAAAGAQESYANAPFRDAPVPLAQAAALDRIEAFAKAIAAAGPDVEADGDDERAEADEDDEGGPLADFALVRGSLGAKAPALEEKLAAAIDAMGEGGDEAAEAAREVIPLAGEARETLLPATVADAPAFRAGVMASLLLDEGGVSEAYEEAVQGEGFAYGAGYFALQRVKSLWKGLAPAASPEQAANVGEMFAMLDALFPGEVAPATLSADPEQAEAPAQQLVGLLEAVANADLYPGRDLTGAAERVHDIAAAGCKSLEDRNAGIGLERLSIAAAYYGSTVADTLGMMAPDVSDAVAGNLDTMQEGEPAEALQACAPLLDALATGQKALTP